MEKWNTKLQLKTNQELIQWRLIKINRGIFQGDPWKYSDDDDNDNNNNNNVWICMLKISKEPLFAQKLNVWNY
jgi:hypothetical protein